MFFDMLMDLCLVALAVSLLTVPFVSNDKLKLVVAFMMLVTTLFMEEIAKHLRAIRRDMKLILDALQE